MLAKSGYNKGILDNGNFREFLQGAGGNFRLSKREFPVALVNMSLRQLNSLTGLYFTVTCAAHKHTAHKDDVPAYH